MRQPSGPRPRRARFAVLVVFFVDGAALATWAAQVPLVKEKFRLPDDVLGLALMAIAVGSVIALLFAGAVVAGLGSRTTTGLTTLVLCLALAALVLVPTFPLLIVALLFLGLASGTLDVAMNAQAVAVEAGYGRPTMSSFHALFSLGGLVGAALASVMLSLSIPGAAEVVGVSIVLAVAGVLAWRALLPTHPALSSRGPIIALPRGPLLGLGILALLSLLSEGAMSDWSAVYLRASLETSASFAALGYAAFSLAMATGRFVGDPLRARLTMAPLLRLSGGIAAFGLGIALVAGQPVVALLGFACVGLGLANVVPLIFSAAGRLPNVPPGTAIAAVATVGYLGFLAGPPLIGFAAQAATLPVALGLVVVSTALIVPLTGWVAAARSEQT
ncbi:MAG: MFS transporter [Chloroflexota bacterium]